MKNTKEIILNYLSSNICDLFKKVDTHFFNQIEEIRLRVNKPIIINIKNKEFTINKDGLNEKIFNGYVVQTKDLLKIVELMSGYSLYAYEEELSLGYLTLSGGHRVGLLGKAILEGDKIKTIKNISFINIRISHEIKGCSNKIIKYLLDPVVCHTLIISPPACGKTTLLRDIIKNISDGAYLKNITVGLVDERSEIAGCYLGIPQNDVGIRTDVLDACPKAQGMKILLRAMSPKVIAVDEIGSIKDINAIEEIINAGIKIIATIHGKNIEDIRSKLYLKDMINNKIFERYVVLTYNQKPGEIEAIFDKNYNKIFG